MKTQFPTIAVIVMAFSVFLGCGNRQPLPSVDGKTQEQLDAAFRVLGLWGYRLQWNGLWYQGEYADSFSSPCQIVRTFGCLPSGVL